MAADKDKVGRITEDDSKKAALANALKKIEKDFGKGAKRPWEEFLLLFYQFHPALRPAPAKCMGQVSTHSFWQPSH